jgi:hypothetical protein
MGVTLYGLCAVTFMMVVYALERRGRRFVLGFAELIWAGVALRRYVEPLTRV